MFIKVIYEQTLIRVSAKTNNNKLSLSLNPVTLQLVINNCTRQRSCKWSTGTFLEKYVQCIQ